MPSQLIGPIMADIPGQELTAEDREVLRHPLVGGVILFTRNYRDPVQLAALCKDLLALKSAPSAPRLLLAVDHEGGRVQRFRVGFTRVPAMATLGRLYLEDAPRACIEAQHWGATLGRELAGYGIDLSFAPVLDVDTGISQVIGDRAFSGDPQVVIALARALRAGLRSAGLASTGKHFPGHGNVVADSHLELPVDRRAMKLIEALDLVPFKALIDDGIESLMMAHVRYTALDATPASLSRKWIMSVLRRKLAFRGAIFCDDLSMNGAAVVGNMEERARLALHAGCDMLPVCNDRAACVALLDALKDVKSRRSSSQRLAALYRQETGST
ncbi:MAG: beta-N-acetylhexosaminidase [Hydrocarboniphaga sp.]|uniref:beta-N-acetylhexosaminidase n=1 Tax=Hydrocarboniphaga sp. TaxID=2033016 RepID=UPI00262D3C92|nr:beta-N-acetylhexosaminidase [Hydrocarboniphaga sp.]MDB5967903.1 beta-N-acetylhexosaminidase [Hydrocarboniphaga sp.]